MAGACEGESEPSASACTEEDPQEELQDHGHKDGRRDWAAPRVCPNVLHRLRGENSWVWLGGWLEGAEEEGWVTLQPRVPPYPFPSHRVSLCCPSTYQMGKDENPGRSQ